MMRAWIGVGLLAVSWLLGRTYYFPANRLGWAVVVIAGAALLSGSVRRGPRRREAWVALLLLLPAVWFAPWPLRAPPLLIVVGLALELLPIPRHWPKLLGRGAITAGAVMLAQSLAMGAYAGLTARCHDLPRPLPAMLAGLAHLLGIDAAADGSTVVMYSIRQVHRLGATWELLLDPATLCFLVGSLVILGLVVWGGLPSGRRWSVWIRAAGALTLVVVLWLPIRAGLLMALYLHRVIRFQSDLPLHVMNMFLSPWVLLLLLAGPVLLAWRFVRLPAADGPEAAEKHDQHASSEPTAWHYPAAAVLLLLAAALLTVAFRWDPVGARQAGRVMVVERHSTWEPTTRPYDTKWFGHDSGYNYGAVYDYLSQFFTMLRLVEPEDAEKFNTEYHTIDNATLADCDVLVIKTPTERYSRDEVDAVERFVHRGGGLLLIGDHTNVFKTGTYLNDVARRFGFTFRHDLLFGTGGSPYDQSYRRPRVPHPIVQHLPPTDFAVSCSIDPGRTWGRAVIRESGLWSLPPDYHSDNYYPVPQHRPEMRYGAFIQLWSTRHGKGRVLAFGDSTIFSNFCTFQPGKAELLRDMVEWLNHRNPGDPGPWLLLVALVPLLSGLWLACRPHQAGPAANPAASPAAGRAADPPAAQGATAAASPGAWLVLLSAGACGWVVASIVVVVIGRWSMPVPEPKPGRRLPRVVIDRTTSDVPLCKGADIQGEGEGYGMFEQWIPRLGYYTRRGSGREAFSGDALVVFCPSRSVSPEFRRRLVRYVAEGGKLLVVDSPENAASTANSLLWPFGLSVHHDRPASGSLIVADGWPGIEVRQACRITGGRPVAQLGTTPVGAFAPYEKGAVMALGFGSFFNDRGMGYIRGGAVWTLQPNANMLYENNTYVRYNVQFALLRALVGGRPAERFFSARVVLDRTTSNVPLAEEDPDASEEKGFKGFEDWISYLGYSATRGAGRAALSGDLLVILYPSRGADQGADDEFRKDLARYVAGGGRLLIIDGPDNPDSTANELLKPFKLSMDRAEQPDGEQRRLVVQREEGAPWPDLPIGPAWKVSGGEPFAHCGQVPIGATVRYGKGAVTAVGFGSVFANPSMRASWEIEPAAKTLFPANLEFAILRALITDRPVAKSIPSVGG